jgi:hypothetical protein
MYVPKDDDIVFKCQICNKSFIVKGRHFEDLFEEALALVGNGAEYIQEF